MTGFGRDVGLVAAVAQAGDLCQYDAVRTLVDGEMGGHNPADDHRDGKTVNQPSSTAPNPMPATVVCHARVASKPTAPSTRPTAIVAIPEPS